MLIQCKLKQLDFFTFWCPSLGTADDFGLWRQKRWNDTEDYGGDNNIKYKSRNNN